MKTKITKEILAVFIGAAGGFAACILGELYKTKKSRYEGLKEMEDIIMEQQDKVKLDTYGYVTKEGYKGRISKDPEEWMLFPTEDEYINYMVGDYLEKEFARREASRKESSKEAKELINDVAKEMKSGQKNVTDFIEYAEKKMAAE